MFRLIVDYFVDIFKLFSESDFMLAIVFSAVFGYTIYNLYRFFRWR